MPVIVTPSPQLSHFEVKFIQNFGQEITICLLCQVFKAPKVPSKQGLDQVFYSKTWPLILSPRNMRLKCYVQMCPYTILCVLIYGIREVIKVDTFEFHFKVNVYVAVLNHSMNYL